MNGAITENCPTTICEQFVSEGAFRLSTVNATEDNREKVALDGTKMHLPITEIIDNK